MLASPLPSKFLPAAGSRVSAGNPSILLPVRQGVARHSRGRVTEFQVSWKTLSGKNIKKRMRCPVPVFSTRPNSSPRALPNCAELSLRARFFTLMPDWLRGSIAGPRHDPRLWSVWRFHVPRIWMSSIVPRARAVKRKSLNLDNFSSTRPYLVVRFPARPSHFLLLPPLSFP